MAEKAVCARNDLLHTVQGWFPKEGAGHSKHLLFLFRPSLADSSLLKGSSTRPDEPVLCGVIE